MKFCSRESTKFNHPVKKHVCTFLIVVLFLSIHTPTLYQDLTVKKHETQKSSIVVSWNPPSVLIQYILFNITDERDYRREVKFKQYRLPSSSKSITLPNILPGRRYKISLQVCYRTIDDSQNAYSEPRYSAGFEIIF